MRNKQEHKQCHMLQTDLLLAIGEGSQIVNLQITPNLNSGPKIDEEYGQTKHTSTMSPSWALTEQSPFFKVVF